MATKTLRPVADSGTPGHGRSSGNSAYLLIDDETVDNDSTYIYQTVSSTSSSSKTTDVSLGAALDSTAYTVTGCRLFLVARRSASNTSSASVAFSVNGSGSYAVNASALTNSYAVYSAESAAMAAAVEQALRGGSVPTIAASIKTTGAMSSSKDSSSQLRVTQVYAELDYEPYAAPTSALYYKEGGTWRQASRAYRKTGGQWVEQADLSSVFGEGVSYVRGG